MSWFVYLPPVISIILVLSSWVASLTLKQLVRNINTINPAVEQSKPIIEDVALDWATRIGFFNSMFVAFVSCFSVYSGTQSLPWTVGTFLVILVIFIFTFFWINSYGAGELVTLKTFFNRTSADLCNFILIVVYIALFFEIYFTQH